MRVTANDVRHALTEKPVGELSLRRHRLQRVFHAPVHTCDNGVGVHALRLGNVDSHLLLVDIVHHIRLTGGNAIAKPTSDGKHQLIDFVDSPDKFVEKVLSIAYDELSEIKKDEHHRNNKITEQNNVYVTTDNQTIQTIMSCVDIFSNEYAFQLKLPSYTRREVMLFASAVNLGGKKIQLLKTQQGSSFLQRLYSLFVGNEAPRSIIDSMQGMSVPCMFADSLHITQRLSDMLQGCTSVSFEDVQCKGKPIRMLKLLRSLIFLLMFIFQKN